MNTGEKPFYVSLEELRSEGLLIHDMPPDVTAKLATYGLRTTTESRDPGSRREGYATIDREMDYALIAQRLGMALSSTSAYGEAVANKTLGSSLVADFNEVYKVHGNGLHLAESSFANEEQKGIVTAKEMQFTLKSPNSANRMAIALQAMLRTASDEVFYPVLSVTHSSDPMVIVENLDEHATRSMSRTLEAVVAQEDLRKGVVLPPDKHTRERWIEKGETFLRDTDGRLMAAVASYIAMLVTANYVGRPDLEPKNKPRIIGTDAAAMMESTRDIMNGLIHPVRGGSHLNLEQHPDVNARPLLERGIDLRRPSATLEDVLHGPVVGRPPTLVEQGVDQGHELVKTVKEKPYMALYRAILKAPGGFSDVLVSAAERLPDASGPLARYVAVAKEYARRRDAAKEAGRRIDELAHLLRRQASGLPIWPE